MQYERKRAQSSIQNKTNKILPIPGKPKPCFSAVKTRLMLAMLVSSGVILGSNSAFAVRPFITDDARIVDVGQIEMENWFETTRAEGVWDPAPGLNAIVGTTVNEWLEILAGSGLGRNRDGGSAMGNPVLIGKFLLQQSTREGRPGHAFALQHTFDQGRGSLYDAGSVSSLVGMTTFRFRDDFMYLHLNYGIRSDRTPDFARRERVYWGIGTETKTPIEKLDFVLEAFAGDPFIPDAPKYAFQTGFRYLKSDYLQFDLTLGFDPRRDQFGSILNGLEFTGQLGVRVLFDAFTPGGRRGSAEGARGLFR
jgi:hypothetical protein